MIWFLASTPPRPKTAPGEISRRRTYGKAKIVPLFSKPTMNPAKHAAFAPVLQTGAMCAEESDGMAIKQPRRLPPA
jgi:hypothetical protein